MLPKPFNSQITDRLFIKPTIPLSLQTVHASRVGTMGIFLSTLGLCFGDTRAEENVDSGEKQCLLPAEAARIHDQDPRDKDAVSAFFARLLTTDVNDDRLKHKLDKEIRDAGWTEDIAKGLLARLAAAIEDSEDTLGAGVRDLVEKINEVVAISFEWADEHPAEAAILSTLVAVGVLYLLAPYILTILGFAAEGPVAGRFHPVHHGSPQPLTRETDSFAAWWQAKYLGYVPAGSWFSFFQRLGMGLGRT